MGFLSLINEQTDENKRADLDGVMWMQLDPTTQENSNILNLNLTTPTSKPNHHHHHGNKIITHSTSLLTPSGKIFFYPRMKICNCNS